MKKLYIKILCVTMLITLCACRRPVDIVESKIDPVITTTVEPTTEAPTTPQPTTPEQTASQPTTPFESTEAPTSETATSPTTETTTQPESPTYPPETTTDMTEPTTTEPVIEDIKPVVVNTVDAGNGFVVGVTDTGRLLYTKRDKATGFGETFAEEIKTWDNLVSVSAGDFAIVGLKADGTLYSVGTELDVLNKMTDVVAVAQNDSYVFILTKEGTVHAYHAYNGKNRDVATWEDIVQIDVADQTFVGLTDTKMAIATGDNDLGQCDVGSWIDVEMVATGGYHTVGLRSDGTVLAAGANIHGECDVADWTDIVYIDAGMFLTIGVKRDGTVVYTGNDTESRCKGLSEWTDIAYVTIGGDFIVGVTKDNRILLGGRSEAMSTEGWSNILRPEIMVSTASDVELLPVEQCIKEINITGYSEMQSLQGNKILTEDFVLEVSEEIADYICYDVGDTGFGVYLKGDAGVIYWSDTDTVECQYARIGSFNKLSMKEAIQELILSIMPSQLVGGEDIQKKVNDCFNDIWEQICKLEGIENKYKDYTLVHSNGNASGEALYIFYDLFDKYMNQLEFPKEYVYLFVGASDVQVINNEYVYYYDVAREDIEEKLLSAKYDTSIKLLDYQYDYAFRDTIAASAGYAVGLDKSGNAVFTHIEGEYDFLENLSDWEDIATISASSLGVVSVKTDGTVCSAVELWEDARRYTDIPELSDWTDIVSAKITEQYVVGLKNDGTVLCWGRFGRNRDVVTWTDIVQIDVFGDVFVGLTKNKMVIAAGDDSLKQTLVGGWADIEMVATGGTHTIGLRSDGTVVAAGINAFGECDVADWTDIVYIDAGRYFTIGVKADGTIVATGLNLDRRMEGIKDWKNIKYVTVGEGFVIGVTNTGDLLIGGQYDDMSVADWERCAMPVSSVAVEATKELLPIEHTNEEITILREEHLDIDGTTLKAEGLEFELSEEAARNIMYSVDDNAITMYLKGDEGVFYNRSDNVYECYYARIGELVKYNIEDATLIICLSMVPTRLAGGADIQDKVNTYFSDIYEQICKLEGIENKYKDYKLVDLDGSLNPGVAGYFDLYMKHKDKINFPDDYVYIYTGASDVQVINPENWRLYESVTKEVQNKLVNVKY
ncbi:MAG: hypothetical protein J6B39_08355 [Lachnospiraceae bacterium]|nr:hypothetical protein [Lachnospiraceae bacterium]